MEIEINKLKQEIFIAINSELNELNFVPLDISLKVASMLEQIEGKGEYDHEYSLLESISRVF
jgi:hypothetical protein